MTMPLEGIRVIETGGFMAAPLAARHLADMGAEVIKIEHPIRGEPTRGITLLRERYTGGFLEVMEVCNRNKRDMGIDIQTSRGKEIVHKLVKTADVFITNFQDDTLFKLELDYGTLSKLNPKLIYALGTGWGRRGDDKDRPGFDLAAFAMTGAMAQMAWVDQPPVPLGVVGLGDEINGLMLSLGIMYALYYRERKGIGQIVHSSLVGAWIEASGSMFQQALFNKKDIPNQKREAATSPLWNCYKTRDERYIQLAIIQSDLYWHDLCEALEITEMENRPPFDSHWGRVENNVALIAIFDKAFIKKDLSEWIERFKNYRLIWAPVLTFLEASRDRQLKDNDYIVEVEHPQYGTIETIGIEIQLDKTPGSIRNCAPVLGQHTEEILLEIGYTWDDIVKMKEEKAII